MRRTIAGKTIEVEKYYTNNYKRKGIKRGDKVKPTTEGQKKINSRNAERKLRQLLNANFEEGDIHLILDYIRVEGEPDRTAEEMRHDIDIFLRECRKEYRKAGLEFKYVHVMEIGERGARHHHLVINKTNVEILQKVDVRVTDKTIEVFYNHNRIASHRRLYGRKGQYSTITEHMPPSHQQYLEWNGDRFRQWAKRIGPSTYQTVDAILTSKLVEQQSYRSCMGLLKLADKYSVDRLEAACRKALTFTATPSYKSIKNILDTGSDRTEPADKAAVTNSHTSSEKSSHALTRGADYYRR